eukprot:TRINITY_DN28569_c0_g1_i1.p1 TRINITY_DN28569_c0_g1~~TRINITY_DN28569_c0_g1_i1.p1  ORF type:complete len:586 (+),score=218.98 TRINITY_DN28569_c0_g1_i1:2139-3896(+)
MSLNGRRITPVLVLVAMLAVTSSFAKELKMGGNLFSSHLATSEPKEGLLSGAGVVNIKSDEPAQETGHSIHEEARNMAALTDIPEDDATVTTEELPSDDDSDAELDNKLARMSALQVHEESTMKNQYKKADTYGEAMRLLKKESGFKRILTKKMKAMEKKYTAATQVRNAKEIVEHIVHQALSQSPVGPGVYKATKNAMSKVLQAARRTISFVARNSVPNMFPKDSDYQLCMKRIENWADVGPPELRTDVLLEEDDSDLLLDDTEGISDDDAEGESLQAEAADDTSDEAPVKRAKKSKKAAQRRRKPKKSVPKRFSFDASPAALAAIRTYATKCTYDRYSRVAARKVTWWKTQVKAFLNLENKSKNWIRRRKYKMGKLKAVYQYGRWKRKLRKFVRLSSFYSRQAAKMDVKLRTEQDARLRQDFNRAEVKVAKELKDDLNPDGTMRIPGDKKAAKKYKKNLAALFHSEIMRMAKEKFQRLVAHFMQHHLLAAGDNDEKPHYDFPSDNNVDNSRLIVGIGGAATAQDHEADYNPEPSTKGDPIVHGPRPSTAFKNAAEAQGIENLRYLKAVKGSKWNPNPKSAKKV